MTIALVRSPVGDDFYVTVPNAEWAYDKWVGWVLGTWEL